ncbi:MAG: HAD family phosphatase [Bacillota bacterium]|nr:HAD family phosphatase [Bacillota bacterium]
MAEIKSIIFDMDGLMFDTERLSFASWRQAAGKYGYEIEEEILKKTLGTNLIRTKEIYIQHFGQQFPIDEIVKDRFEIAEQHIIENGVSVKEGLYVLLDYLNSLDIKKAVATSTSRERATNLIKMANVYEHFDYIICGDEIEQGKPHPEIFLKAAEKLGCLPENCMVLEDSQTGILAAYRAGMMPVMIPDLKEPDEETQKLLFRQMKNLSEVKLFLEEVYAYKAI